MQRPTTTQKAPNASPAQSPTAAAAAAPAAKRSWMGPLAGLAAGLGLAALASHLGFGSEFASMMMIGLAIMAVLAVIGFLMRKRAAAQPPSAASAGGMQHAAAGAGAAPQAFKTYDASMPNLTISSTIGANLNQPQIPADFDVLGFVRNARVQFIRLQAANDAGNLDDIRQFTTPEMFAELKMDITERAGAVQETDVVSVNADVLEVAQETTRYVVSVRFTGTIREGKNAATESFDEVWHLVKSRVGTQGWHLSGIQQS